MALHIAHLEDERDLLEGMAFILEEEAPGALVAQFANSDDLIAYIDQHCAEIDLYILDVRVPGVRDGLEVARYIREHDCPGGVVVTSAYDPPPDELMRELAFRFIQKPWELPDSVQEMLRYARKRP
jgi:DNA-binding NtrC family response regulator